MAINESTDRGNHGHTQRSPEVGAVNRAAGQVPENVHQWVQIWLQHVPENKKRRGRSLAR
jgi:hypothetical protein